MSKAFTRENDAAGDDDDEGASLPALPVGAKNYLTPAGYAKLKNEYLHLLNVERPALVQTVSWAASNGDRSENGDYIYGKKRLREIDRRLRFLAKRLEHSQVIDPAQRGACEQVFFGATVTVLHGDGSERTYSIVGIDEANPARGHISWVSPLARVLLKARVDDTVPLPLPGGVDEVTVIEVAYCEIDAD
ncbi:transcription elongation factor GreB [Ferrigenium sp. UT5]|uniref:transcription elongation factor GreB n=1 Tax=Ferrigenium sp. UT5 TaxID=3242105 RepID=UPI0035502E95